MGLVFSEHICNVLQAEGIKQRQLPNQKNHPTALEGKIHKTSKDSF